MFEPNHMSYESHTATPATRFIDLPSPFKLKCGCMLNRACIAYETFGQPNQSKSNTVLILTGLSTNAHAAANEKDASPGWWEKMIGPGKPIDTNHWFVICVNSLGSCKGSTGPASPNPETGKPYNLDFPELAIEDIADASAHVIRQLGYKQIECVIGASMGGMSSLAFITRHPTLSRTHINICGAARALPFSIALRSLQREAICSDPNWSNGNYTRLNFPRVGMTLARKLGVITYRSAQEWEQRFDLGKVDKPQQLTNSFGCNTEVERYLDHQATRFVNSFDPNCYLYLSRSMDRFNLGDGDTQTALSKVSLHAALVLGASTDILFPPHQQQEIASGIRRSGANTQFAELNTLHGHDAFLIDIKRFGPPIAGFLSNL